MCVRVRVCVRGVGERERERERDERFLSFVSLPSWSIEASVRGGGRKFDVQLKLDTDTARWQRGKDHLQLTNSEA